MKNQKRKCDSLKTLWDRASTKRTASVSIQQPQHDSETHIEQDISVPKLQLTLVGVAKQSGDCVRFHVDMFLSLIDRQLQELNDRFDEVNTNLLICMSSFKPADSFASYNQENLVKLAQYYPMEFSKTDLVRLSFELTSFVNDMRTDQRFRKVKNLAELSIMLVETKKDLTFPLVYKLLKLVLVLPVATAGILLPSEG